VGHRVATVGEPLSHPLFEPFEDPGVLDLADAQQVPALPFIHGRDNRGELIDLAIARLRCPALQVFAQHAAQLLGSPWRVLVVEQVLDVHHAAK
jgi:hypothetical protein